MNQEFINQLNSYGSLQEPFFFMVSYDKSKSYAQCLKDLDEDIQFEIHEKVIATKCNINALEKFPMDFQSYKKSFDILQEHIKNGNSYLLNLTFQTPIKTPYSLQDIYNKVHARFKLKYKEEFVCFSPERFIEIKKNKIYTYPMKGTIDANTANAKARILGDVKEMAEHTMVVDLLRNDLGIIANKVRVDKFRFCEKINAGNKKLLQVSSKISAHLKHNWKSEIGNILDKLLPAGSITGTPKKKTVEILNEVENYERGFYTGVAGIFDGNSLYSFVLIRFVQQDENKNLFYKSGGGITCDSNAKLEYEELINKIYFPL